MADLEDRLRRLADTAPRPLGGAPDPAPMLDRARQRRHRAVAAVALPVVAAVFAVATVVSGTGSERPTSLATEPAETTDPASATQPSVEEATAPSDASTTTVGASPAAPTTTGAKPRPVAATPSPTGPSESTTTTAPTRRMVLTRPGWMVYLDESTGCLDLVVGEQRRELMCGAEAVPGQNFVRRIATVQLPSGLRLMVAEARRDVTNISLHRHAGGIPELRAHAVAVVGDAVLLATEFSPGSPANLFVEVGVNTVAGIVLPVEDRVYTAPEQRTARPFGFFADYRRPTNSTSGFQGGLVDTGFYTGTDGSPCALHRWFGGEWERVAAEWCVTADGGPLQGVSVVRWPPSRGGRYEVFFVSRGGSGGIFLEYENGDRQALYGRFDPSGSGWRIHIVEAFTIREQTTTFDLVLMEGDKEAARRTVEVPQA